MTSTVSLFLLFCLRHTSSGVLVFYTIKVNGIVPSPLGKYCITWNCVRMQKESDGKPNGALSQQSSGAPQ